MFKVNNKDTTATPGSDANSLLALIKGSLQRFYQRRFHMDSFPSKLPVNRFYLTITFSVNSKSTLICI